MANCSGCGAEIVWAETPDGKRQPFDREPNSAGNRVLLGRGPNRPPLAIPPPTSALFGGEGRPITVGKAGDDGPPLAEVLYMPHHATCPERDRFRRSGKVARS